jgi:hypothetical protein
MATTQLAANGYKIAKSWHYEDNLPRIPTENTQQWFDCNVKSVDIRTLFLYIFDSVCVLQAQPSYVLNKYLKLLFTNYWTIFKTLLDNNFQAKI